MVPSARRRTDLLHHRLGHGPKLRGLLKLLLLHRRLYCLGGAADVCQANIIQQGLQSKDVFTRKERKKKKKRLASVTYGGVEVGSPRRDRVCDEAEVSSF